MFQNLLKSLFSDTPSGDLLASQDAEVAIAALLVRVARSDGNYEQIEKQRINRILAARRGLLPDKAAERLSKAEKIEAEAPDTVRFTRQIKDRIALEDRVDVISAMWRIAYADESRAADEETLIRLVAGLLGVSDRDSGLARQRVLIDLGLDKN